MLFLKKNLRFPTVSNPIHFPLKPTTPLSPIHRHLHPRWWASSATLRTTSPELKSEWIPKLRVAEKENVQECPWKWSRIVTSKLFITYLRKKIQPTYIGINIICVIHLLISEVPWTSQVHVSPASNMAARSRYLAVTMSRGCWDVSFFSFEVLFTFMFHCRCLRKKRRPFTVHDHYLSDFIWGQLDDFALTQIHQVFGVRFSPFLSWKKWGNGCWSWNRLPQSNRNWSFMNHHAPPNYPDKNYPHPK